MVAPGDKKGLKLVGKQRKAVARKGIRILQVPVPQTDTGRRGENPKASERKVVKELGKFTP